MEKRKIIKIAAVIFILTATIFITFKNQDKQRFSTFVLSNSEALAAGERDEVQGSVCWGIGDVTCPIDGDKVENYVTMWSLK